MNALKLNICWTETDATEQFAAPFVRRDSKTARTNRPTPVRQLAKPLNLRCPNCHSIVYSRRHPLCGVCSQALPEEFLFTAPEADRVGRLLEIEKQRHKRWMSRALRNGNGSSLFGLP